MKGIQRAVLAALTLWAGSTRTAAATPDVRKIDSLHSTITVHVYKSGLFSGFAHDHEVEAPIETGEVNESGELSVELRIDTRKLHVLDPEASPETRAKIQETMQGPEVLDSARFSEIHFQSTSVEPKGSADWIVRGNLDLHGQVHPVAVDVTLKDGLYRGSAILKQTVFGIKPVTVAGGTVKVKDDLKVEFEIALVK
jgi:polyisoprenoid-binding protein YceI